MKDKFRGIWPAMVTPLDESGRPALGQVEKLVELFAEQEMGGLYILGSTGQGPLLSLEERMEVTERVVRTSAGRLPVIVHVGTLTCDDSIRLARHAAEVEADAVTTVAPYYYGPSADIVFEHYRQVASATDLPFFAYHLSVTNTLSLGAREYVDRLMEVPHIAGMKFTDRDTYQFGLLNYYSQGRLLLFSGADEVMCQAALCGAVGAVGSFYNVFGPICHAAREAFLAGNIEIGQQFMHTFQSVIADVLATASYWQFFRSAMRLKYDIEIGLPRAPFGSVGKTWEDRETQNLLDRMEGMTSLFEADSAKVAR